LNSAPCVETPGEGMSREKTTLSGHAFMEGGRWAILAS
jgi:hypothetical protein